MEFQAAVAWPAARSDGKAWGAAWPDVGRRMRAGGEAGFGWVTPVRQLLGHASSRRKDLARLRAAAFSGNDVRTMSLNGSESDPDRIVYRWCGKVAPGPGGWGAVLRFRPA